MGTSSGPLPVIEVTPNPSLIEETISIIVKGLNPEKPYTLCSYTAQSGRDDTFGCIAHYHSDVNGAIDVSKHSSVGGCYKGVMPMALIWELRVARKHKRTNARAVRHETMKPMEIILTIHEGFLDSVQDCFETSQNCVIKTEISRRGATRKQSRKLSVHDIRFSTPNINALTDDTSINVQRQSLLSTGF